MWPLVSSDLRLSRNERWIFSRVVKTSDFCWVYNDFCSEFLVFYDVTSLFTNIPLQEIIDIVINLIVNPNPNLNITRKELKKLFLFATSKTHFIFNSKFYNQIDVVSMGSPLAPVLANIFMGFHESKCLNKCNLNKPKFYLRYVDGIVAAFDNEQDSLIF